MNTRKPYEDKAQYHARLKRQNDAIKEHLKGRFIHISKSFNWHPQLMQWTPSRGHTYIPYTMPV